ncbi:hypothetical protein AAHA92_14493 [Salvia divinorum]|uniref:Uncharacterized protein n=1 Tax=Salvia divinorum TaxID=28513 RepID=A0ABD1HBR0_SALDI
MGLDSNRLAVNPHSSLKDLSTLGTRYRAGIKMTLNLCSVGSRIKAGIKTLNLCIGAVLGSRFGAHFDSIEE